MRIPPSPFTFFLLVVSLLFCSVSAAAKLGSGSDSDSDYDIEVLLELLDGLEDKLKMLPTGLTKIEQTKAEAEELGGGGVVERVEITDKHIVVYARDEETIWRRKIRGFKWKEGAPK